MINFMVYTQSINVHEMHLKTQSSGHKNKQKYEYTTKYDLIQESRGHIIISS